MPSVPPIFHPLLDGKNAMMLWAAVFAMGWVLARACVQSITIDEADTYNIWVARFDPAHWEAAANNHVLNSLLMRLITSIFGVHHLTVRGPALLGAAIYITSAYWLCRFVAETGLLRVVLLMCLVYNPFILDHLVAARGYSLAMAFLLTAITCGAFGFIGKDGRGRTPYPSRIGVCAICSVLSALSFAANFSFAFVDAATMLLICVLACHSFPIPDKRPLEYAKILGACILPGLIASLFLSLSVVLRWPKGQLQYGAKSWAETFQTILNASLYQLNPQVLNPLLFPIFSACQPFLLPVLCALCAATLVSIALGRRHYRQDPRDRSLALFGCMVGAILVITVGMHWLAFRIAHLNLPNDRTAIFLIPLFSLLVGTIAAVRARSGVAIWCSRGLGAMLCVVSLFFVLCLRLDHFKEWYWNGDMDRVYWTLSYYNHAHGTQEVGVNWKYGAALNFYRLQSGHESFKEFMGEIIKYPAGKDLYVLDFEKSEDQEFFATNHLKMIYLGELSRAAVAVSPELDRRDHLRQ